MLMLTYMGSHKILDFHPDISLWLRRHFQPRLWIDPSQS